MTISYSTASEKNGVAMLHKSGQVSTQYTVYFSMDGAH